jgi:hypothetical protein
LILLRFRDAEAQIAPGGGKQWLRWRGREEREEREGQKEYAERQTGSLDPFKATTAQAWDGSQYTIWTRLIKAVAEG